MLDDIVVKQRVYGGVGREITSGAQGNHVGQSLTGFDNIKAVVDQDFLEDAVGLLPENAFHPDRMESGFEVVESQFIVVCSHLRIESERRNPGNP